MNKNKYYYLIIPDLQLENANFQQGWLVKGMLSITALGGWVEKLRRKIDPEKQWIKNIQAGMAIHQYGELCDRKAYAETHREDKHYKKSRVKLEPLGMVKMDLLLRIQASEMSSQCMEELIEKKLRHFVMGRLAGGWFYQKEEPNLRMFQSAAELMKYVQYYRHHTFFVLDASEDLKLSRSNMDGEMDALDNLLSLLSSEQSVGPETIRYAPGVVGYALLEKPVKRSGARNELVHAYAEPLLSLIKMVPVVSIKQYGSEDVFWRWFWKENQLIYKGSTQ
ncbi:type I-F CRISPR-associated protein Csy2 [Endozoicomonas euniceicola]|uniref:Type I-F CRISPR-associated protein Csy2 n=1 Tax=Endozoicomonas euniceicola TaxID=1234143 RepID=A0ABY6GU55_9GAMM|nr:type I-F CRISPR-associated protein Csy2 [Endozoicomonas euniceicola]UYM16289.1 hypothetical protein NX720_26425 [Endozoicomonas euniceicola]